MMQLVARMTQSLLWLSQHIFLGSSQQNRPPYAKMLANATYTFLQGTAHSHLAGRKPAKGVLPQSGAFALSDHRHPPDCSSPSHIYRC